MRWVEVVEVETGPAVGLAGAVDVAQAGWVAPGLPDPAGTAFAPVVDTAKRTW